MLRTDVFRNFDIALSVVGGSARAEGTGARPSRGAVNWRSDIWILLSQ